MKIASLETGIVLLPNDEPLGGFSENPNAKNPIVWLKLRSDVGIEGLGVCYFGGALTRTLRHAVDELGALIIGDDPLRLEAVAKKLRDAAGQSGPAGILTLAMSAIDVALWDLKGKALGLPLWKLLGGGRDRIATYASGALRRGLKLDEAITAGERLRQRGHRQTKMQLGLPGDTSPKREVEQAVLIRQAVGPDMDLMCDINQRWRPEQAIDIGRRVEDAGVGLFWLEDVTTADDYAGLARVADALSTPVAGG
jgi:L-alanine-DL-glutamate epimerase-like enolase superfamily enzyme